MLVLGVIRQSKRKEQSESPEVQRRAIQRWADDNGHTIVGWAIDLGVSASVAPDRRRELGPWLKDPLRLAQWQILAGWKVDRVVRSMKHWYGELIPALEKVGKHAVSVTENINTLTSSAMEVGFRVMMAQEELDKLKSRARGTREGLRLAAKWHGGKAPFGTIPVKTDDGWKLGPDPDAVEIIETWMDMLELGNTPNYLATFSNQESYLTALDRHEKRMKRKVKHRAWRRTTIVNILSSRHLLGQQTHKGEIVRGEDGRPLQYGVELVDRARWERIQPLLPEPRRKGEDTKEIPYKKPKVYAKAGTARLRQVAFCIACGRPLYRHGPTPRDIRRYICARDSIGAKDCKAVSVPAEVLEAMVEEMYLSHFGHREIVELEATALVDYETKMKDLGEQIENVIESLPLLRKGPARDKTITALNRLQAEHDELTEAQQRQQGVKYINTGRTYGQEWVTATEEQKSYALQKHGVVVMVQRKFEGHGAYVSIEMGTLGEKYVFASPVQMPTHLPTDPESTRLHPVKSATKRRKLELVAAVA